MQRLGKPSRSWLRDAVGQGTTWLGLGIIALGWIGVAFHLDSERQLARGAAVQNAGNMARAFEEHTFRAVREVDKTLLFLRTAFEQSPETFDLRLYTRNSNQLSDLTLQVALIGASGIMMASNVEATSSRVDLSDREHFRFHVSASHDQLFISKPVVGRASGRPSIQLTRRLMRNGAFAGVIVGSLDPGRLSEFYTAIDVGPHATVRLFGTDGAVRASGGLGDDQSGAVQADPDILERARLLANGSFVANDPVLGTERLVSYRTVRDLPLIVAVEMPTADIFASVGSKTVRFHLVAALLTLLVLAVILYTVWHSRTLDRAQRALADSQATTMAMSRELRATLDNMSQGIMMIDPQGRIAVMNTQAIRLLDLPEELASQRPTFEDVLELQWRRGEFGRDGVGVPVDLREYIRAGGLSLKIAVYERERPNGSVLEVRTTPLPDGGLVRTFTDVTERAKSAEALATARDAAESASRTRSAFLAVMSHEIRTPLNGVIGMADLLLDTPLSGEQARYARTLRVSADHLLQIINDVLDFSKLEADRTQFEQIPLDLEATIDSVVEILAPRANETGIFVGASVDPSVPNALKGDPAVLRQILLNLVGNGVKFTEKGSVMIQVSREETLESPGQVGLLIRVRDTGIGIPADAIPALFQEFSQVDGTISRRFGGTGLGLAITRQLVERLGGKVGVDSEPDVGSCFWFTLPVAVDEAAPAAPAHGELAGRRILIVSADPVARDHYARVLRQEGAWAEQAITPDDALARLRRQGAKPYDGALVDEAARGSFAVAFAEAARTTVSHAALPLTLITVSGHRLEAGSNERILFDRVLARPVSRRELVAALRDGRVAEPEPVNALATEPEHAASRGTVLLAEDNATNRLVITTLLKKLGFACHAVNDGQAAVAAVQADDYDIVLMDVMMPVMDGYAATRAIRALGGAKGRTPIVALTANVLTADVTAALNAGMDDFATKPISRDRLEQVMLRVLEKVAQVAPAFEPAAVRAPDPALDRSVLAMLRDEIEPDSVRQIIEVFVEDTKARLAAMPKLIDDPIRISREAHAIKSAAATFGMMAVSAKAAALEQDATRLAAPALVASVDDLTDAFDDAHPQLMSA